MIWNRGTLCQQNSNCFYFTWLSEDFFDPAYRLDCYLKAGGALITNKQGAISGPRDCGSRKLLYKLDFITLLDWIVVLESCCDILDLYTIGMGDFYQGERLGKYKKVGNSNDGRYVYKQENGDNYLFYMSQYKVNYLSMVFRF